MHVTNRANTEHVGQQTLGNIEKGVKRRDFVAEDTREGLRTRLVDKDPSGRGKGEGGRGRSRDGQGGDEGPRGQVVVAAASTAI